MKHTERALFKKRALIKPVACLTLALSSILIIQTTSATTDHGRSGELVWCNGDGTPNYDPIPDGPFDTTPAGLAQNPIDTFDPWNGNVDLHYEGWWDKYETDAPPAPNANDRYAIQLNYWNSIKHGSSTTNAPFGHSPGHSCVTILQGAGTQAYFTISYPAKQSVTNQNEIDFHASNPNDYPQFVPYVNGPTAGGPTGYISTFKGCSWDDNSCTAGSKIPAAGATVVKSSDPNVFPEKLSDITSIPSQWTIEFNSNYGMPGVKDKTKEVWDASYDIWFDKTAHTAEGQAPYGMVRGQNDGLEIMVWMNSNGSYVDSGTAGTIPTEGAQPGLAQPTGHIRERVVINNVLYDVWVGRLNNPYFGYTTSNIISVDDVAGKCPTSINKGAAGVLCGVEWNVVSFVATKDSNGRDYRSNNMSLDAKVFADYLLGIQDGMWQSYGNPEVGNVRTASQRLQCPASNKDQSLGAATADCLDPSWYLMSVQAGFEPWIGGNGLQSDLFKAHVITKSTGIQTGLVNDAGNPIIHWQTPFDVVYSGCSAYSASNHAAFLITGFNSNANNAPMTYPANGVPKDMGAQDPATLQFTSLVTDQLYPMHGDAFIHFTSTSGCAPEDVPVFIDPSGKIFYSDGKTAVKGAAVTLQYSPSGSQSGPFVAVPNHNAGLSSPIMQPDDNTQNSMLSTAFGTYAWNTSVGWYKVNASLTGCGSVTTAAQQVTVNNPIENLNITLPCAPPAPLPPPPASNGVTVQLTVNGADWQNGYCRNIVLKNTTNKAVTWKVSFNLPFPGNITQTWNINYSKSGNTMTAWGIGWDNVLQPGQTLSDTGFCATK